MSIFAFKLLALLTMAIDHIAAVFSESVATPLLPDLTVELMHAIGRIAFPLYAFMLVEGFRHTRDWRKYALRMFGLGLLSQIPYAFTINGWVAFSEMPLWRRVTDLNILFTLTLGVLLLAFLHSKRFEKAFASWGAIGILAALSVLFYMSTVYDVALALGGAALLTLAARFTPQLRYVAGQATRFALFGFLLLWLLGKSFPFLGGAKIKFSFDYGIFALALFAALYWVKTPRRSAVVITVWGVICYAGALIAVIPVLLTGVLVAYYNGQKGKNDHRLFYWAYPAHLFLLWGLLAILT